MMIICCQLMAVDCLEGLHIMMVIYHQLMAREHWEGLHIIEYRTLGVYVFSADGHRTLGGTVHYDDYVFSTDGHRTLGGTAH